MDDEVLRSLHARAFGNPPTAVEPWAARLARHSVSWVGIFDGETLIGFVHAVRDGGTHLQLR